jgi:hypothetical protein
MKKLPIPENITLRWEAWPGMGKKELIVTIAITTLVAVIAVIFCMLSTWKMDTLVAMIAITATFGFCSGLFTKMENNQSIYDYLKQQTIFRNEQQTFWYKRKEERIEYVNEENN